MPDFKAGSRLRPFSPFFVAGGEGRFVCLSFFLLYTNGKIKDI
jgi:hypothetical protein